MPKDRSVLEGILAAPEEHPLAFEVGMGLAGGLGAQVLLRKALKKAAARGTLQAGRATKTIGTGTEAMQGTTRLFQGGLRREFGGKLLGGKLLSGAKAADVKAAGGKARTLAVRDSTLGLLAEGVGDTAGVAAAYALEPEHIRPENLGFTNKDFSNPLVGLGVGGAMAGIGAGYRALRGGTELYHDTGRGWAVPATKRGVQPDRPIPAGSIVRPEYDSPIASELALQRHVDTAMLKADEFAEEHNKGRWDLMDADAYQVFSRELSATHPDISPIALSILPILRPLTTTAKGVGKIHRGAEKIHRRVAKILGNDFPSKGDISWLGRQIKKAEKKREKLGFFYAWEMSPTTSMAMSLSIARFGFGGTGALKQLYKNRGVLFDRMVMHEALNGMVEEGRYMGGDSNAAMQIHDYFWGKSKLTMGYRPFDGADPKLFDDIENLDHLRNRLVARAGSQYHAIFHEFGDGPDSPMVNMRGMQSLLRPMMERAKDLTGYSRHGAVMGGKGPRAIEAIEGAGMAREAIEAGKRAEEMIRASMMGEKGAELLARGDKLTAAGRIEAKRGLGLTNEQLDDVLKGDFEPVIPATTLWEYIEKLRESARAMEPSAQRFELNEIIQQFDNTLVAGLDEFADALEASGSHVGFIRQYKELNKAYKSLTNELSGVFGVTFMQELATDAITRRSGDLAKKITEGIYTPGVVQGKDTGFDHFALALLPDKQWVDAGILDIAEYDALMERGITLMGMLQDDIVSYVFTSSVKINSAENLRQMLRSGDLDTSVTIEFDNTKVANMLGAGDNQNATRFWDSLLLAHPEALNKRLASKLGDKVQDARIYRPGQRASLELMKTLLTTKFSDDLPFRLAIQFLAAHEAAKVVGLPLVAARGAAAMVSGGSGAAVGAAGAGAAGLTAAAGAVGGLATGILGVSLGIGQLFKHPKIMDKILQGAMQQRVALMTPHLTRALLTNIEVEEQRQTGMESDSRGSSDAVSAAQQETDRVLESWKIANTPETPETPATPGTPAAQDESVEGPGEALHQALGMP